MKFYLGTHQPTWLWADSIGELPRLFISVNRLTPYQNFRPARMPWALDSGGFTEVTQYGHYRLTPREYITHIDRYSDKIGDLEWASQQDWMCEEIALRKTGLTVEEHQQKTVENYLELSSLGCSVPIIPVLQGYTIADYLRCADLFEREGIELRRLDRVGVGSVCRRQGSSEIAMLFEELHREGFANLHGFGVKADGLRLSSRYLRSSDSMAWSLAARKRKPLPNCSHSSCSNCPKFAEKWHRETIIPAIEQGLSSEPEPCLF